MRAVAASGDQRRGSGDDRAGDHLAADVREGAEEARVVIESGLVPQQQEVDDGVRGVGGRHRSAAQLAVVVTPREHVYVEGGIA